MECALCLVAFRYRHGFFRFHSRLSVGAHIGLPDYRDRICDFFTPWNFVSLEAIMYTLISVIYACGSFSFLLSPFPFLEYDHVSRWICASRVSI